MECFYCGKPITEDEAIHVHDDHRNRDLVFCSEPCRDRSRDDYHYRKFPPTRTIRKQLHRQGLLE